MAGIAILVRGDHARQLFHVEGHLGDDGPVHVGQIAGDEAGLAAVAAEQLDEADALVAADGRAQIVQGLHGAGDGRAEADAVVGAEHIVVHGLGNGDLGIPGLVQPRGVAEGVVAADGDEGVDLQGLEVGHHRVGDVHRVLQTVLAQVLGHVLFPHLGRVGARGVQEGAAGAVDGAHVIVFQDLHPVGVAGHPQFGLVVGQSAPAAPETVHLQAGPLGPVHHLLHGRVQAGHVAPAGQDRNSLEFPLHRSLPVKRSFQLMLETDL